MTASTLTFHIGSDLYDAGRSCDGHPYIAENYYVVAEAADGSRYRHAVTFPGCKVYNGEETDGENVFVDQRDAAGAAAERLLQRIVAAGGRIDLAHWIEDRPCYGSAAYQAYGRADDLAWERAQG